MRDGAERVVRSVREGTLGGNASAGGSSRKDCTMTMRKIFLLRMRVWAFIFVRTGEQPSPVEYVHPL